MYEFMQMHKKINIYICLVSLVYLDKYFILGTPNLVDQIWCIECCPLISSVSPNILLVLFIYIVVWVSMASLFRSQILEHSDDRAKNKKLNLNFV